MGKPFDLVVLGATGFTGRLVAEHLARGEASGYFFVFAEQIAGNVFCHYPPCQAFRNGSLAYAGLTDQDGIVLGPARQDVQHPPDLVAYLRAIGAAAYHPDDAITTRELIRTLRAAGFGINVYTVNDRKRQQELFAFGATAVFTDYPELPSA